MPNLAPETRCSVRIVRWFAAAFTAWCVTAWLGRGLWPWQIQLTNVLFAASFTVTYALGWALIAKLSRAPTRRVLFRAVACSLVLAVIVFILELPAVFGLVDYGHIWNHLTGDWSGPNTSFSTDMNLGFGRPANKKWRGQPRSDMAVTWNLPIRSPRPITFSTDSRGFRNLEDRDRAEVVLIGDSFVEGAYVSDDETAAVALERAIGVPVVNLGRAGYGTLQELEVLERTALPLRPRLIAWFFYEGNDLYNDQEFTEAITYLREHGTYTPAGRLEINWNDFRRASLTGNAFRLLRRVLDPVVPNSVATFGDFRDSAGQLHRMYFYDDASVSFDQFEQQQFERTKAAFRWGMKFCDANSIQLLVLVIPTKFRVYSDYCKFPPGSPCHEWTPWDVPARLGEFCDAENIAFVDLTNPMQSAAASGQVLYAPDDSHWCREGHGFVAELLRDHWQRISRKQ